MAPAGERAGNGYYRGREQPISCGVGPNGSGRPVPPDSAIPRSMHVNDLLKIAVQSGASDLHVKVGTYPMMRVRGTLIPATEERRL